MVLTTSTPKTEQKDAEKKSDNASVKGEKQESTQQPQGNGNRGGYMNRGGRGRGRFDGGRGGRGRFQQGNTRGDQQQNTEGNQNQDNSDGGHRGGRGRGGFRGGRGGGGERREKIVHPPPQFSEDGERLFTGRCRLFVGNIPQDMSLEDFQKLFEPFGQSQEAFVNAGRGFGFIRMDTRYNAVKAKRSLDGKDINGRFLRVRFASHPAALKVKHLHSHVSNELLAEAFSAFGEVERATVIIDDKGRPTGEGIVEFVRKPGASAALHRIGDGVFLMGSTPRPVVVMPLVDNDEEDGLPEKFISKNSDYVKERESGPRFAPMNSFEYEFGLKWKEMYMLHEEAEENLRRQFTENTAKLEIEQANAQMEFQTQKLREELVRRQEELRKMEDTHQREMQMKLEMRRGQEENRRKMEEMRKREEEENRMKMERYQQQQQERMQAQQEMQLRELQEMRRMREEQQQMGSGRHIIQGDDEMAMMRGEMGDVPAMKPPPAPPAALTRGGNNEVQSLMDTRRVKMDRMSGMDRGMGGRSMERGLNQRQSRFDQGASGNGFSQGGMGGPGGRGMDRRDRPDDFFDVKRARRF